MEDAQNNQRKNSHQKNIHQERRRFLGNAGLPLAAAALAPAIFGLQTSADAAAGPLASVDTLSHLRALPTPPGLRMILVGSHHKAGDAGGGLFSWQPGFLPPHNVPDDGGICILPAGHLPSKPGRWRRVFDGAVHARWFGALGDDSGRTPHDDGLDISAAPWNRWPDYLTSDAADNPNYFGFDTRAAPFSSTDSWDRIGIQLALFSVGESSGEVMIAGGIYRLTQSLFLAKGMRATLTGAGMYQTTLTKKPGCFDRSSVLYLYRIGGVPTIIRSLNFSGPFGGGTTDFHLIVQNNTNGVHLEDCWLTTCQVGVFYVNNCSDSYVTNCSAEFCETVLSLDLDAVHLNDNGSEVVVQACNFWQSAAGARYTGIAVKGGSLHCSGSRFIGFNRASIEASLQTNHSGETLYPQLLITGNQFSQFSGIGALIGDGRAWVVSGNRFVGAAGDVVVSLPDRSTFTGNYVEVTNSHACLNINQGARYAAVTGNTFINSSGKATVEGGLVVSVKQGENYSGGCSHCAITGNCCGAVPGTGGSGIFVNSSPESGNLIANNVLS